MDLAPGERLPEGGGRLVIVQSGTARRLAPGVGGSLGPVAELRSGDAFGVAVLLGDETGSVLEAIDRTTLLVLDDEAIAGFAAIFPTVSAALTGSATGETAPVGGRRLSRVTIGPESRVAPILEGLPAPVADLRRATGQYPTVGS